MGLLGKDGLAARRSLIGLLELGGGELGDRGEDRGLLGGGLLGSLPLLGDGLAELAQTVAEGAGDFGQTFGPQDEQGDDADEDDVNGILDAHNHQASARLRETAEPTE